MPQLEAPGFRGVGLVAAADLSAKQYLFGKLDSNGKVAIATVAGEEVHGVIENKPASGEAVAFHMGPGFMKVIASEAIAMGDDVSTAASGKARKALAGDFVIGRCVAASGADNEMCSIWQVPRIRSANGIGNQILTIPVNLASLANGDVLTNYVPGFAGKIRKLSFAVTVPATTAAKAATLNLEIGTTNLTGGVLALTSANCTPLGAVVDATAITAANVFGAADALSVEASAVTAFVEGAGVLLIALGE